MTIEEARALIPPGWVECSCRDYHEVGAEELPGEPAKRLMIVLCNKAVYAIPAPKPEPRRVPCGEMRLEFHHHGYSAMFGFHEAFESVRDCCGGWEAVANTKWRLDPDAREWVEVLE